MNDVRVLHNNLLSGAGGLDSMKPGLIHRLWFRFDHMDPTQLTERGRERIGGAISNERRIYLWMAVGLVLCGYLF